MLQPKVYIKSLDEVLNVELINFDEQTVEVYNCDYMDIEDPSIGFEWYSFDAVEFMKNTGLKDKYREDIYEGDIVRVNGTWNCIIEYNQSSCAFVLKSIDSRWSTGYFSNYDDIEEMLEVIGNVYENEELLKWCTNY